MSMNSIKEDNRTISEVKQDGLYEKLIVNLSDIHSRVLSYKLVNRGVEEILSVDMNNSEATVKTDIGLYLVNLPILSTLAYLEIKELD